MVRPLATLLFLLIAPPPSYASAPPTDDCASLHVWSGGERGKGAMVWSGGELGQIAVWGPGGIWDALAHADRCAAFLESGRLRLQVGDYVGAERAFKKALERTPGDAEASFGLAQVTRERPKEALAYAEQAAAAAATRSRRAAALRLAAEIRLDVDDRAGARTILEGLVKKSTGDLEALEGLVRLTRDDPKQAAAFAAQAFYSIGALPLWMRAAAFRLSARLWLTAGDPEGARFSLECALGVDPDDLEALETLVSLHDRAPDRPELGDPAQPKDSGYAFRSEEELVSTLKEEPQDLETLRRLAAIMLSGKRMKEAAAYAERFLEAVREAPAWQQEPAYRVSARMFFDLGDPERASSALRMALQLDRRSLDTLRLIARLTPGVPDSGSLSESYFDVASAFDRLHLATAQAAFQRTEESLTGGLKAAPEDTERLRMMVDVLTAQHRLQDALPFAERLAAASEKAPAEERAAARAQKDKIERELKGLR